MPMSSAARRPECSFAEENVNALPFLVSCLQHLEQRADLLGVILAGGRRPRGVIELFERLDAFLDAAGVPIAEPWGESGKPKGVSPALQTKSQISGNISSST